MLRTEGACLRYAESGLLVPMETALLDLEMAEQQENVEREFEAYPRIPSWVAGKMAS